MIIQIKFSYRISYATALKTILGRALGKRDKLSNFLFLQTVRAYKVTSKRSCKGNDVPPDLTVAAQMLAIGIQQLLYLINIKSQESSHAGAPASECRSL